MKRPKIRDEYWNIDGDWCIDSVRIFDEGDLSIAKKDFKDGNYFKTKKEAKSALRKIIVLLKQIKKEEK